MNVVNPLFGSRVLKNEIPKEEKRLEGQRCPFIDPRLLFATSSCITIPFKN
jgi:hypothetical protein